MKRETIIEVSIYPRRRVNNVNEDLGPPFVEFNYINTWAWGDVAKIKNLKVIVNDTNIAITEITYLQQAATDVLYIIVDEIHPLFNLNLFLTNIVYDTPDELADEAHSELNDMLQALIESYGVDLNKR